MNTKQTPNNLKLPDAPIHCFLCEADITNKERSISFHNFPDKLWNDTIKNWDRDFRKLFNRALCAKCAQKDLDAAHEKHKLKSHRKEWVKELEQAQAETKRFYKLFGNLYIRL